MFKFINNRIFELSGNYIDLENKNLYCNQFFKIAIYLKRFKFNKYFLLDLAIQLYLTFFSIVLFPLAIVIHLFNFKIYKISNHSFGDYLLEMYIVKKNFNKYKVIVPTNSNYKFNKYEKILFKEIKFIKNFFISHILNAISLWSFSSINIFNNRDQIIEPKHYINNPNWSKNFLNLREYHIYKYIKNKKLKIKIKDLKKVITKKKKIAIINPRMVNDRKNKIRNSNLKNYLKTINFLKKRKYNLFLFGNDLKFKKFCNDNGIKFININNGHNKFIQTFIFKACDLYIGSYSGMGHFTDLFKTKSIYVDEVFYNGLIFNENSYILPKKILFNNKNLNYKNILSNNLDNIYVDKDIISKKVKLINVSEKELFQVTKKILSMKEKKIKINKSFKLPISINNLASTYYKSNLKLFN